MVEAGGGLEELHRHGGGLEELHRQASLEVVVVQAAEPPAVEQENPKVE